jgi:hypothetical protein
VLGAHGLAWTLEEGEPQTHGYYKLLGLIEEQLLQIRPHEVVIPSMTNSTRIVGIWRTSARSRCVRLIWVSVIASLNSWRLMVECANQRTLLRSRGASFC